MVTWSLLCCKTRCVTKDYEVFTGNCIGVLLTIFIGGVVQMARTFALQAKGRGFESHRLH